MARQTVQRLTCDRCRLTADDPSKAPAPHTWKNLQDNSTRVEIDLCPDCASAFQRWMAGAKSDTSAAA